MFDARQVPAAVVSTSNKDTINLSAVSARDALPYLGSQYVVFLSNGVFNYIYNGLTMMQDYSDCGTKSQQVSKSWYILWTQYQSAFLSS